MPPGELSLRKESSPFSPPCYSADPVSISAACSSRVGHSEAHAQKSSLKARRRPGELLEKELCIPLLSLKTDEKKGKQKGTSTGTVVQVDRFLCVIIINSVIKGIVLP